MSQLVLDLLKAEFKGSVVETHAEFGDETAVIDPAAWQKVGFFLRDEPKIGMNMFTDLTACDYLGIRVPRFEVVCHLRSLERGHRIRIKARVGEEDGSGTEIDTLVPVWKGANWFEREAYDMVGIIFRGHPDLRRILMYPEFVGHPLRKDYPADRIQPLIPFREGTLGKLPPFGPNEGMPFGRQTFDFRPPPAADHENGAAPRGAPEDV